MELQHTCGSNLQTSVPLPSGGISSSDLSIYLSFETADDRLSRQAASRRGAQWLCADVDLISA